MLLNIAFLFYLIILYCRWCGVSPRNEACKGFPVVHFLELLVFWYSVLWGFVHFINYSFCNFSLENKKVFSIATIVFFNNSLHTYYNYNTIFLMCNIRELFRDFWSLNTHLLLDWSFWSLDLFRRYLLVTAKRPKSIGIMLWKKCFLRWDICPCQLLKLCIA